MKLLLHICCAPCTIYPLGILKHMFDVKGYFYNPNIHPYAEFLKRLETVESYSGEIDLPVLYKKEYHIEKFFGAVVNREDERCRICYNLRLRDTARTALQMGMDYFSTTLLYSKYMKHDSLRKVGIEVAREFGVKFFYRDFRPGWHEGVKKSVEMNMYRQKYCGCIFSERERLIRKSKSKNQNSK